MGRVSAEKMDFKTDGGHGCTRMDFMPRNCTLKNGSNGKV